MPKKAKVNEIEISVVVPVFNEQENIIPLAEEISLAFKNTSYRWECIWVNDGSTDNSRKVIEKLPLPHKGLYHSKNQGQSRALGSGINVSKGRLIVMLDGDGQNDPQDIPQMLKSLGNDYDLVQGYREHRKDEFLRKILSQIANVIAIKLLKSKFTDMGCTLRVVRKEFVEGIEFIGEVHRVLAFHLEGNGARVLEIAVNHRPRVYGSSKYGYNRIFKFVLDLVLLNFLLKFREKPLYYFGILGVGTLVLGISSIFLAVTLRILDVKNYLDTSLVVGGIILLSNSILFIGMGLLGEIVARAKLRSQKL